MKCLNLSVLLFATLAASTVGVQDTVEIAPRDSVAFAIRDTVEVVLRDTVALAPQNITIGGSEGRMSAGGRGLFVDGRKVTYREALDLARPFSDAVYYLRSGRGFEMLGYVISFAGGYMIGWTLGGYIAQPNLPPGRLVRGLGIGFAVIGLAFGVEAIAIGQYRQAARIYNDSMSGSAGSSPLSLTLGCTAEGLGVQLRF